MNQIVLNSVIELGFSVLEVFRPDGSVKIYAVSKFGPFDNRGNLFTDFIGKDITDTVNKVSITDKDVLWGEIEAQKEINCWLQRDVKFQFYNVY